MIGRAAERARLDAALRDAIDGRSRAVVVRGGPGIGRTTLLDALVDEARQAGVAVHRTRGIESERDLTWAGLSAVCRPFLRLLPGLAEPRRQALAGALALGPSPSGDRFTVAVATLDLLAAAAADADDALVVVVDDAQALDRPALDVLSFVARRLDGEGILLVLGIRAGDDEPGIDGVEAVRMTGLTVDELAELVRERTGRRLRPEVAAALCRGADGNPGVALDAVSRLGADELAGAVPLPDPLPAGPVAAVHDTRLDALPAIARRVLAGVAAVGEGDIREVERLLATVGIASDDIDGAIAAGVLARDHGTYRFPDPALRVAAYARLTAAEQRDLHARLADAVTGAKRARHLVASAGGPDERVADVVAEAAKEARNRCAFDTASALFEDAARLAPSAEARAAHVVDAAECALFAGGPARALDLAASVDPVGVSPRTAARAAHVLGRAQADAGGRGAIETFSVAADRHVDDAPDVVAAMLVDAAVLATAGLRGDHAVGLARRAHAIAVDVDDVLERRAAVALGAALVIAGETVEGGPLLARWRELVDADDLAAVEPLLRRLGYVLVVAERYDEAGDLLSRLIDEGRSRSMPSFLPDALLTSAIRRFSTGEWDEMEAEAREAVELADATDQRAVLIQALANLGFFEAVRGRPTALDHLDEAVARSGDRPPRWLQLMRPSSIATLALGQGDPASAAAALRPLLDEPLAVHPGSVMWEAELADALVELDQLDEATLVIDRYEARAVAAGNRRATARAASTRAWIVGGQRADELEVTAEALLSEPALPFVLARARLLRGRRLVQAGRDADGVDALRAALSTFHELGAEPWVRRATDALAQAGRAVHPRDESADVLTADERRVVGALVSGASVLEIAAATFRSPRSVERHVADAMSRLGVADRAQLSAAAAGATPPVSIRLLGAFEVHSDQATLTPPPGMAAKVLKLVALSGGTLHADEVSEALWPGAGPGRGRARLRNVLNRLRATSGEIVVRAGDMLALTDGAEVDVLSFRAEVAAVLGAKLATADDAIATAQRALRRYEGDLLPDSIYESWSTGPRERLRRDRLQLLDRLAELLDQRGDLDGAITAAEEAIAADPYDEARYVALGRRLLAAERRSAAAVLFRRARAILDELDMRPSDDLVSAERAVRRPSGATDQR